MQDKQTRTLRTVVAMVAVFVAAGLAGCNSAGLSPAAPDPVQAGSGSMIIFSDTFEGLAAGAEREVVLNLPHEGTLRISVAWTNTDNQVISLLTGIACGNFLQAVDSCQVRGPVGQSPGRDDHERVINYRERPGAYRLWVKNLGPGAESIEVKAQLTYAAPVPPTPDRRGER